MIQYLNILLQGHRAKADERGATAVEYGLLVALIAAALVLVITALSGGIQNAFQTITDAMPGGGGGEPVE